MITIQAYLTFALVVFLFLPLARLSLVKRLLALLLVLLVGALPLPSGIPLAGYLRGLTDDLAITTMVWLLVAALIKAGLLATPQRSLSIQLWLMFAALGLLLYPAAMGVGMLDPYRWGYSPRLLIVAIGLLALFMLWLGNGVAAAMLALATAAFVMDLKPSGNYWDYLIDPFVVIYALLAVTTHLLASAYAISRRFQQNVPSSPGGSQATDSPP